MRTALEKARSDPESLKSRLLEAAKKVFAQRGYHAAGTRAIAAECGVDVSTVYYHWGSKQELFEGVLEDMQVNFEQVIRDWFARSKDLSLEQSLDVALETVVPFLFRERHAARVLLFSMVDYQVEGSDWDIKYMPLLIQTMREFARRKLGITDLPPAFDLFVMALVSFALMAVASSRYQRSVLDIEDDEAAHKQLMTGMLRNLIRSFVTSGFKEASDGTQP